MMVENWRTINIYFQFIQKYKCTQKSSEYYQESACNKAKPRGYKAFFMLNSTEHEIATAHKK